MVHGYSDFDLYKVVAEIWHGLLYQSKCRCCHHKPALILAIEYYNLSSGPHIAPRTIFYHSSVSVFGVVSFPVFVA